MKSMKLPIWLRFTLLAGVVILTAGASLFAQTPSSGQSGHGIDLKSIATTVRPCQNFYEYANGHWLEPWLSPPDGCQLNQEPRFSAHDIGQYGYIG